MVAHPRFRIRSAPADPHHMVVVPFHVTTVVVAVAAPIAAMIAIPAATVVPRAAMIVAPATVVATARSARSARTAWTLLAAIRIILGARGCGGERGYGKTGRSQHVRDFHEGNLPRQGCRRAPALRSARLIGAVFVARSTSGGEVAALISIASGADYRQT